MTVTDYMGGSHRCIVACTYLGNGTGHRTATMAAPLLLTSGPARYEAVLHNNLFSIVCVFEGMDQTFTPYLQ